MTARTVLTIAALTLREAARRRVLRSLAVLTVVLLGAQRLGVLPARRGVRRAHQRRGPAGRLHRCSTW